MVRSRLTSANFSVGLLPQLKNTVKRPGINLWRVNVICFFINFEFCQIPRNFYLRCTVFLESPVHISNLIHPHIKTIRHRRRGSQLIIKSTCALLSGTSQATLPELDSTFHLQGPGFFHAFCTQQVHLGKNQCAFLCLC